MIHLFWAPNVFHRDMSYDFVHGSEQFVARFLRFWLILVDPETYMFLSEKNGVIMGQIQIQKDLMRRKAVS